MLALLYSVDLQWSDDDKDPMVNYASQMFDGVLTSAGLGACELSSAELGARVLSISSLAQVFRCVFHIYLQLLGVFRRQFSATAATDHHGCSAGEPRHVSARSVSRVTIRQAKSRLDWVTLAV